MREDRASRLWLAMGFPAAGEDEVVFTDGDIEALRVWDGLVTSGILALDDEVPHARAMGQALSRLAEWQALEVAARAAELTGGTDGAGGADGDQLATTAAELATSLLPVVERLQSYVWRRHLAAAADRALRATPGDLSATTVVVGFADIVGYTSAVRHSSAAELAALLEAFEESTADIVVSHRGRVVKTVGDEVLFVVDDPCDAAEIAVLLTEPGRSGHGLPALRVGLAAGPGAEQVRRRVRPGGQRGRPADVAGQAGHRAGRPGAGRRAARPGPLPAGGQAPVGRARLPPPAVLVDQPAPISPLSAAHCSSMIVLPSAMRPSATIASASANGTSSTSMSSPSSASPPPAPTRSAGAVRRRVEVQPLGDRARAHVDVEHVPAARRRATPSSSLRLAPDRGLGVVVVEQPGRGLDEHAVGVAVDVGRDSGTAG